MQCCEEFSCPTCARVWGRGHTDHSAVQDAGHCNVCLPFFSVTTRSRLRTLCRIPWRARPNAERMTTIRANPPRVELSNKAPMSINDSYVKEFRWDANLMHLTGLRSALARGTGVSDESPSTNSENSKVTVGPWQLCTMT
ncbi:hypothetical protein D9M70_468420 [compost metagenome]